MKTTTYVVFLLVASALFSGVRVSQDTKDNRAVGGRDTFATRWELSKGGIGMINKHLYVVVESASNERNQLIVKPTEETEERWYGKGVTEAEVAIFYEGKVWSSQGLPDGFDLSKAVVISFERDRIRFFDFQTMAGAYFERIKE